MNKNNCEEIVTSDVIISRSDALQRSATLFGAKSMAKLDAANAVVIGLGGVGSFAAEALARSGVGTLVLIDGDQVDVSNLNRQLIATQSTLGRQKATVTAERLSELIPGTTLIPIDKMLSGTEEELREILLSADYVVDCIDSVPVKLALIETCIRHGVRIVSAMGLGRRFDPGKVREGDLSETHNDPLARVMRRYLRRSGIIHLPVVYSTEEPVVFTQSVNDNVLGSFCSVTGTGGLFLAARVIRDLVDTDKDGWEKK